MKLTNRLNLPAPIIEALKNDEYSKGDADISVTTLVDSARLNALRVRHWNEIEEDASDRIWSLFGQAVHTILERADKSGVAERRLTITVNGWKLSGQMDRYETGLLQDYKVLSAFAIIKGVERYENQLNVYAELLRQHGHPVTGLELVVFVRDWSAYQAERDPTYPQAQVVTIPVPLWSEKRAKDYIWSRILAHQSAMIDMADGLHKTLCTNDERWVRDEKWAVKKVGGKVAMRGGVFDTEGEAKAFAGFDKTLVIEHRPGTATRCEKYCPARKFCAQANQTESARPADPATEVKTAV